MSDFFKYLTSSKEDIQWGLYLNVAGASKIDPKSNYPSTKHPRNYFFNWENGRILHEFQINYITSGNGILETKTGSYKIYPGSIILLFPGMWHRYKPEYKTGWTEHYIGFNGKFTDQLFQHELFDQNNPIIKIGFQENLVKEFNELFQLIKAEKPRFQHECAGKLIYLLARIISIVKNNEFANKEIERTIRKACLFLRDNLHQNISIEYLAKDLNISHSYFRRIFKKYTGMSPNQYHLGLRLQKSKEMIQFSNKSIKTISLELGFESIYYFSRIFKKKEGISPSSLRIKKE